MFSLVVFTINYYLTKPELEFDQVYSEFRCAELKLVPVIRIFGSTPEGNRFLSRIKHLNMHRTILFAGQKTCLHIHNVFPYFFIKLNKMIATKAELDAYMSELGNEIDKSLNIAFCIKDLHHSQHVYKIEPVMTK